MDFNIKSKAAITYIIGLLLQSRHLVYNHLLVNITTFDFFYQKWYNSLKFMISLKYFKHLIFKLVCNSVS